MRTLLTLPSTLSRLAVPIFISLGALGLSSCEFDTETTGKLDNVLSGDYCQSIAEPFVHVVCQVSQQELSAANTSLSLHLFWKSGKSYNQSNDASFADTEPTREPLHTFDALINDLPDDTELIFAVNAGMYDSNFAPIGYTVLQGKQILSLNLNEGAGNFHLMPNGVLWWGDNRQVQITESQQFGQMLEAGTAKPMYASQSGPMLVIENQIHPKFNPNSTSLKIRNGAGVCEDGNIKFVTSSEPVNFYQFATYFKDNLQCSDALFLDGGIASALYAPGIHQKDDKNMGVMLGLVHDSGSNTDKSVSN